eukprot:PhM_4_TR12582/c0_g1_i1/m.81309
MSGLHILETDRCLTHFFSLLERKRHTNALHPPSSLRIQPTVVVSHNVYRELYRWSPTTGVTRETDPNPSLVASTFGVDTRTPQQIMDALEKAGVTSGGEEEESFNNNNSGGVTTNSKQALGPCVAYMIERREDNSITSSAPYLAAHFLPARHLKNYLVHGDIGSDELHPVCGAVPDRSGILQMFVPPTGNSNQLIRVNWEDGEVRSIHVRRTAKNYNAKRAVPYERCVTFEGPSHMSALSDALEPETVQELVKTTNDTAIYLQKVERKTLLWMTLFFKQDSDGVLWFQYTYRIRFLEHKDDAPMVVEMKFRPPVQFKTRTALHPKYDCVHEEDLIQVPKMDFRENVFAAQKRRQLERFARARDVAGGGSGAKTPAWELRRLASDDQRPIELPTMYTRSATSIAQTYAHSPPEYEYDKVALLMRQKAAVDRKRNPPKRMVQPVDPKSHFLHATDVCRQRKANSERLRQDLKRVSDAKALLDTLDGERYVVPRLARQFGLTKSVTKMLSRPSGWQRRVEAERAEGTRVRDLDFTGVQQPQLFPPPNDILGMEKKLNNNRGSKATKHIHNKNINNINKKKFGRNSGGGGATSGYTSEALSKTLSRHQDYYTHGTTTSSEDRNGRTTIAAAYATMKSKSVAKSRLIRDLELDREHSNNNSNSNNGGDASPMMTLRSSRARTEQQFTSEYDTTLQKAVKEEQAQLKNLIDQYNDERRVWQQMLTEGAVTASTYGSDEPASLPFDELEDDDSNGDAMNGEMNDGGASMGMVGGDGRGGGGAGSGQETIDEIIGVMLEQDHLLQGLEKFPSIADRHTDMRCVAYLALEYIESLQYHLTQHFLAERSRRKVLGITDPSVPPNPLVVSVPAEFHNLERHMETLIRGLPHVQQLNNGHQSLTLMRELIMKQKRHMDDGREGMEDIFCSHLHLDEDDDGALRATTTFAFMKEPNRLELRRRLEMWKASTLVKFVRDELADIEEELHVALTALAKNTIQPTPTTSLMSVPAVVVAPPSLSSNLDREEDQEEEEIDVVGDTEDSEYTNDI